MSPRYVQSGKLRHEILLRTLAQTPDGSGGHTEAFSTLATVFASIERVEGSEDLNAGMLQGVITHKITFRYDAGLTTSDQIRFGSRDFEIVELDNFEERDFVTVASCKERSPT